MNPLVVLATFSETPVPSPSESVAPYVDPERVTPGFLGFLFFVILIVATVILYISLRKQLRKVDFQEEPESGDDPASTRGDNDLATSANGQAGKRIDSGGNGASGSSISG